MIIEVQRLTKAEDGLQYNGEEPSEILNLDDADALSVKGPVSYDFKAELVSNELVVIGSLSADVWFKCSRCCEFFGGSGINVPFERVVEVSPNTDVVDLTGDIREAIILAFPTHPICAANCKGLCSQCGTNLNEADCDCKPVKDGRWGVLDNLKLVR